MAEAIHVGMSQSGDQCDIVRLKDAYSRDLANRFK
jgi:hypothetical protein